MSSNSTGQLLTAYLSFPHLWCPCLVLNLLLVADTFIIFFVIQNKAIRITIKFIFNFSKTRSHSEPPFKSFNLVNLDDIIQSQILSFVYQWSHRILPLCFNDYFKFTSSVHRYSACQSCHGNLYITSVNTIQYGLRSLKFTGSCLWNSLPTSISKSISLALFCKALKNSLLNCVTPINY